VDRKHALPLDGLAAAFGISTATYDLELLPIARLNQTIERQVVEQTEKALVAPFLDAEPLTNLARVNRSIFARQKLQDFRARRERAARPLRFRRLGHDNGILDWRRGLNNGVSIMRKTEALRWGALVVPIMVGLAASSILLVDYMRPAPVFCDYDGGCGQVSRSTYASLFGIKTPFFGVAGFFALATFSMIRGAAARVGLALTSAFAGAVAVFLIYVQTTMGALCPYCMVADVSALVVFVAAMHRMRVGWDPPAALKSRTMGSAFVSLAFAGPLLGFAMKPRVPSPIAAEIARTPKGMITVVDFVDFECPFCRETQAELQPVLDEHKGKIRLVRFQVPLGRIHPHANDAARAACCGEAQGKGDAFADALFTTPEDELTKEGCEKIAASLGLDVSRYRACVIDPKTEEHIQRDSEAFRASGGRGLPTIYVNEQKLEGGQDRASIEEAVRRALGS
jgi:uncharacterized membrane protein/predicted DsbA family dithiol-disulfide isomerase